MGECRYAKNHSLISICCKLQWCEVCGILIEVESKKDRIPQISQEIITGNRRIIARERERMKLISLGGGIIDPRHLRDLEEP
ncbi:MAG: hypothetical protein A2174_03510 [Candidatus Portnoybacteria bacterium RBG_13_41_18]|uniref:Uncharacterized protein n=1 Tax=Candidatus Portnoybacteria bacterium RBG_13_41_18 TaxID=1801991 RepID=A0A1G2F8C4_9BACT|nr:MAG: hypothetical protein A2174_03510 [Candidatus Portnoybacteria bacterium RBG_13_41_18]